MADINEARQQMMEELQRKIQTDSKLSSIRSKIQNGDYSEASQYGVRSGEILSEVIRGNITEELFQQCDVKGLSEMLLPVIKQENQYVSNAVSAAQKAQNAEVGIGIKPLQAERDLNSYFNIFGKMKTSDYESFKQASWLLDEPIVHDSLSVVDDTLKENADFQYKSGLRTCVIRDAEPDCCDWCAERAGTYYYPDVPDSVWKRHNNCLCEIRIETEKGDSSKNLNQYAKGKDKTIQMASNSDRMGRPKVESLTVNGKQREIRVFQNDTYPKIFNQTYSKDSQELSQTLNTIVIQNGNYREVDEIIIAKSKALGGISAYNHESNTLYISEELNDSIKFAKLVDGSYFPARNIEDIVEHELGGHQSHWDAVMRFYENNQNRYSSIEEAKDVLEERLRKYVKEKLYSDPEYIKTTVSLNADVNFEKTGLNELIADVKVLNRQGAISDEKLLDLVCEVLDYDGLSK